MQRIKLLLGLLLALCLASPAFAGSSIVATPVAGTGFIGNVTSSAINTTGATFIRITITSYITQASLSGPSDNKGNTYTQLGSQVGQSGAYITYWYAANPSVGTGHTFTYGNAGLFSVTTILAYSGVSTTSPVEATFTSNTTASAGSIQPTSALTPVNNGDLLEFIGTTSQAGGIPFSSTGGYTQQDAQNAIAAQNVSEVAFNLVQNGSTASQPTLSYTSSGPPATVMLVAIKPASYTPPAGSSNKLMMHAIP